jgi:hemolysin activation/secretion protein
MIPIWWCLPAAIFFAAGIARAESPASSAAPVHVSRILIRGNRAVDAGALQAVAAPYLGRDLYAADIADLCSALTHRYTDHGFINSSVVPDPDSAYHDGVLSLLAIEGRIKEIRVQGLKGLRPAYVVARLRGQGDEVMNTEVLRARLQRLSEDPLLSRVSANIESGTTAGESNLVVDVQQSRPFALSAALNNYRPPTIGEKAYDLSGQVRDLTGLGDLLDAGLSGPMNFSGGIGYALSWQVPVNRYGTVASLTVARINTVFPPEPLSTQDIRSTIDRRELKLMQPLWASVGQQVNLSASIAQERESTPGYDPFLILPGSNEGSTRSLTERLIPEYSYRTAQQYLNVRFTLLHAKILDYPTQPVFFLLPDQNYFMWSGQFHHLWEIPRGPFELESRAIIQRTNAAISDLHALGIGGISSVRGFREDEILASNADNFNLDFRWHATPPGATQKLATTLGAFFDWARGQDVGGPTDTFSSCGLTLRLKWPHVQADFAYGLRLEHPAFVSADHGSWQDHGIHVQIATTL